MHKRAFRGFAVASCLALGSSVGCVINDSDDDDTGADDGGSGDGGDGSGDSSGGVDDSSGGTQTRTLMWELTGLEDLGADYEYEGWIIVGGEPVSTGRFSVDEAGVLGLTEFEVDAADAAAAERFVLTIEPVEGDDPGPSASKYVGGLFDGDAAPLSVADGAALGTDFTEADGGFILETPTSANVADDYSQGIWWLDPAGGPGQSLKLPELPEGWAYEGWVVTEDGPLSTGRFQTPAEADSDGAGATAGPDGPPPFPGQDYIDPAMSLIGTTAVISVEPEPDNAAGPFTLKPLVFMDVRDVPPPDLQVMTNNAAATNPTGMAWFAN